MTNLTADKMRPKASRAVKAGRARSGPKLGRTNSLTVKKNQSSHDPRPPRPTFTMLDRLRDRKLGVLVTVELDQDTDDFAHLIGKKIVIDGKVEMCFSVERLPHRPPIKKGERVSLLIRKN